MLVINCRALKLKLCKLVKFPGGSEQCIEILKPSKYQGVLCLMNFSIKGIKANQSKGVMDGSSLSTHYLHLRIGS